MTAQATVLSTHGLLEVILRSQREGRGCLPYFLGMMPLGFVWIGLLAKVSRERWQAYEREAFERGQLRQELLQLRQDEWQELRDLLLRNRTGHFEGEWFIAEMVAAGCLGGDHLWRDLGLDSRDQLSQLMARYFRPLFLANDRDMKWKKFFYKQLCEEGGGYVCRAPSCDQCTAYHDCFGPED